MFGAARLNTLAKFTAAASTDRNTFTASGNAQISTAQSQFGGASALFDGTGDWISCPDNSTFELPTTTAWTVEFWIRPAALENRGLIGQQNSGTANGWGVYLLPTGNIAWIDKANSANVYSSTSGGMVINTWYHIAVVRSSSSLQIYIGGTRRYNNTSYTTSSTTSSASLFIGTGQGISSSLWDGGTAAYNGYIDEIRISNIARYTNATTITVPSAAFANDANTVLLLHCNGTNGSTVFTDDYVSRAPKTIAAVGNAQVSTAQSKFGGASALFDGTGDYLNVTSVTSSSTTFTIEGWFYITNNTTRTVGAVWQGDFGDSTRRHMVYFTYNYSGAANRIYLALGSASTYSFLFVDYTVTLNTWFHLAISRDASNDIRWFVNGTQVGSTQNNSRTFFPTASLTQRIGSNSYETGSGELFGYVDEFRISNTARYTANFTEPSAAFTNDTSTLLLLHNNGSNGSTTFTDDGAGI